MNREPLQHLAQSPVRDPKHPFDAAIALQPLGGDRFTGATHPAWNNMVGPFGGITAATALNAVMQHPDRLGEPVALTVNFASALAADPFTATAHAARTNRSTQHWTVVFEQASGVALTATVMTAVRRDTWGANDLPMPVVTPPEQLQRLMRPKAVEWVHRYDMRPVTGSIPTRWEGQPASEDPAAASLTQLWMRDEPPRPLDFGSLAAIADVFFPRIWLRRATIVPVGTVSMTVYFHASGAQLAEVGTGFLLGQARAQAFAQGYFDQTAQLWSEAGRLLATTHQVVYYKE